jgi:hypothetical protein
MDTLMNLQSIRIRLKESFYDLNEKITMNILRSDYHNSRKLKNLMHEQKIEDS